MTMNKNKKIIIVLSIIFFLLNICAVNVFADAGPKNDEGYIILGVTLIVGIILTYFGIKALIKWFKKLNNKKAPVSSVLFDREHVYLSIGEDEMEVEAVFEYENTNPNWVLLELLFPFQQPVEGSVRDIRIITKDAYIGNESEMKNINYEIAGNEIHFDLLVGPHDKINLCIKYAERLHNQKASYVLTSIKRWKRPVSSALFTVKMPSSFQSPRFTYQDNLTSVQYNNETGHVIYSFEMKDLYPDTEFDVYWDKTPKLSADQIGLLNRIDHSTNIETAFY